MSRPMQPIIRPRQPESRPFIMLSPAKEPMMVRPNTPMRKYSRLENFSATCESAGAMNKSAMAEIVPPIIEATVETPMALRPLPCLVRAKPSAAVAADAGVPGVWSRQAVIEPP